MLYRSLTGRCVWPADDAKSLPDGPHRFLAAAAERLGSFREREETFFPLLLSKRISDDVPTPRLRRPATSSVIGEPLNHPLAPYTPTLKAKGMKILSRSSAFP